jgi:hypothetical protein
VKFFGGIIDITGVGVIIEKNYGNYAVEILC